MPFKSRTQLMNEVPRTLDPVSPDMMEDYLKSGSIDNIIDVYESQQDEGPPEPETETIVVTKEPKERWQPKRWSTMYDVIVALHLKGMTNAAIAKQIRKSPNWISVILTSDKAKELIKEASKRIIEIAQSDIENRIKGTADRALTAMDTILSDSDLMADHPLPYFDRALKFTQAAGVMKSTEGTDRSINTHVDQMNVNQNNLTLPLNNDMMKGLMDALSKSDRVMERRTGLKEIASASK